MNSPISYPTPAVRFVAILAVLLSLPALVVPFVSFTWRTSPYDTIDLLLTRDPNWVTALLGAPFFTGILIVAAQVLRIAKVNFSRPLRLACLALAAISAALSLTFFGMSTLDAIEGEGSGTWFEVLVASVAPAILAIGGYLMWRTRRAASATVRVVLALATAYLANAALCLWGFSDDPDLGWWLALVASAGIALEAIQVMVAAPREAGN